MTARRHFGVRRLAAAFRGDTGAPTENCMGGTDGIAKAGASSRTPRPAFAGTTGGQKQIPRAARDDKSRVTSHGSRLPATAGRQEDAPCTRRRNPRAARLRRTGPTHERGNGERLEDSPRARWIVPYKKKETQEEGARFGKRPLQGGEGSEFGVGDG